MREHDEIKLARAVSTFLRKQLDRVLGHPPDWEKEDQLFIKVVEPILHEVALAEAIKERNKLLRQRQEGGLFERVLRWAREYSYKLVGEINGNTRKRLAIAIAEFVEGDETMGTLREEVADIFTPERADCIAVTEVTRAYSEGGAEAATELREAGLEIIERWRTVGGGACDACQEREGRDIREFDNERPPLHPYCRCRVTREIA